MSSSNLETNATAAVWRRLAAFFYDLVFLLTADVLLILLYSVYMFYMFSQAHGQLMSADSIRFLFVSFLILLVIANFAYFVLFDCSRLQGTLGKSVFSIKVGTTAFKPISLKQSFCRFLLFLINISTFGLGLLPILLGKNRQTLHDKYSGTSVFNN